MRNNCSLQPTPGEECHAGTTGGKGHSSQGLFAAVCNYYFIMLNNECFIIFFFHKKDMELLERVQRRPQGFSEGWGTSPMGTG